MTARRVWERPFAILLAGLFLALGPACSFNTSGIAPPPLERQVCTVEVWQCPSTAPPAKVAISDPGGHPEVGAYRVVEGLEEDKGTAYQPYVDQAITFVSVDPAVRGATLVMTGRADWKVSTPAFLGIELLSSADAVYVAYDSRATTPPAWLTGSDPNGLTYTRQAGSLVLSRKDPATGQYMKMDLWRLDGARAYGEKLVIPGNSFGNPVFPNLAAGSNPLMYVVLVQRVGTPNCASGTKVDTFTYPACVPDASVGQESTALAACAQAHPNLECRSPSCTDAGTWCGREQPLTSYDAGSLVQFIPPSRADVEVGGETSGAEVSGTLRFSYEGDLRRLTVNELVLGAGTVSTDVGQFENTVLSLVDLATAECQGWSPALAYRPCDDYQIATGDLQVDVSTRFDGRDLLWSGENIQPMAVHIDHTARTFGFSGTVLVSVETDDGPVDLTAGLDLHGFIADVVPQAVAGEESQLEAECVEDRNDEPLLLSAAGSFQVYASSPQNLPRYEWWEDFGLVTQHEWGTAKNVTIPRGALAFGSHEITLLVGDQSGLLDTATVEAAVVDTVPPVFSSLPADITTDIYPAGTESVQVELGVYSARDACNPYVEVTNNAPEGGWFTPGTHTVTWRADDLRGNVTEVTQQVNVRVLGQRFPWQWVLVGVAGILILGGAAWLLARRGKAPAQRSSSEATLPPPPPTAGSRAPVWIAAGAGIMVVAAGTVAAFLLLGRDNGEPAAGSTTTGQVTTTGQTPTTSPGTGSSEGTTTSPEETTSTGAETTTTSPEETTSSMAETTTSLAETTSSSAPTTIPGPTLNPDGPATYGEVKLVSGFLTDPAPYPITAGGPIDLTAALPGQGCLGFAAANPDLRFQWEGEGGLLRFYYFPAGDPDSPPPDTTLTIRDPAGGWHCNDDSYGTPHPTVDINPSQRGYYQIWVGTYQPDQNPTGTLNITELDTNHP